LLSFPYSRKFLSGALAGCADRALHFPVDSVRDRHGEVMMIMPVMIVLVISIMIMFRVAADVAGAVFVVAVAVVFTVAVAMVFAVVVVVVVVAAVVVVFGPGGCAGRALLARLAVTIPHAGFG
jgi:hypothetical protein